SSYAPSHWLAAVAPPHRKFSGSPIVCILLVSKKPPGVHPPRAVCYALAFSVLSAFLALALSSAFAWAASGSSPSTAAAGLDRSRLRIFLRRGRTLLG